MTPEQFRRLEELYDAASVLDPEQRDRFIGEQCAGDQELRRELIELFHESGSGLTGALEQAAAGVIGAGDGVAGADDAWAGKRVGPYRIVRPLGRGGMGAVYLAVRDDDQFHKEVAIKTLKFELEGTSALMRFRHERQILAHLEHPNIARLLDGGATEQGTPYIVLEYVAGSPIAEWCEERQLPIDQRLRLFRQVCDAVQYAHQHLIVHRDIKPGNILVTSEGVPKLLDFGIAKLLDTSPITGPRALTATNAQLMTPDYASPEQVRGEPVSTATDVYSLGAVLYQLLTGKKPHDLKNYDTGEILRIVCETEIRPPSSLGNRRLRGDLDNIVVKAMQKEPARRYSSAVELSEDIRRHLEGLPIAARPDTPVYRAIKFVRRHRIGVAAAAAVVAALSAGVAVSLHEARIAERRFGQVRELANTFLFQFYDQVTPLPGSTAVRASIVETARKYLDGLASEAGNDKSLVLDLAAAYSRLASVQGRTGLGNLGQIDEARRNYQRAIDLYARLPVDRNSSQDLRRRLARVLYDLSRLEYNADRENAAEPFARKMVDLLDDPAPEPETAQLRASGEANLGDIRLRQGHTSEAVSLMESSKRTLLGLQASGHRSPSLSNDLENTSDRLARARAAAGDLDRAASDYMEMIRGNKACDEPIRSPADCRSLGIRIERIGDVYGAIDRPHLGDLEKAASFYEQAIRIARRLGELDPNDRQERFDLASRFGKLGDVVWESDPNRALQLYDRAMATLRGLVSKEQVQMLQDSYYDAIIRPLIKLGRLREAREAMTEALRRSRVDDQSPYADRIGEIATRILLPSLLAAEGNRAEAKKTLEEIIRDVAALRAGHPDDLGAIFYLCQAYRDLAGLTTGEERRQAYLASAAAWRSWPATTFTTREEQRDLAAAASEPDSKMRRRTSDAASK